jgi:hypothetical protein
VPIAPRSQSPPILVAGRPLACGLAAALAVAGCAPTAPPSGSPSGNVIETVEVVEVAEPDEDEPTAEVEVERLPADPVEGAG